MAQAFEKSRQNMIDGQLLPNHITNPLVIDAMASVPREAFVPCHLQRIAYADETLALGQNRFLSEPLVLARLIQAANVGADEIVLDIPHLTSSSLTWLMQVKFHYT